MATTETITPTPSTTTETKGGLHKLSAAAIMLGHTAVDMQTSALNVLLPTLLATFHLTYASAAAIISANNIVIAIAQPLFGIVGDYRQARWLVPLGCVLCGGAMASVMFMPNYWLVVVAVILSGLGSAAFHPEALSSMRAISGAQKATGSSLFFFAGNMGFALGPLVAAWLLEQFGNPGAVWLALPVVVGVLGLGWQYGRLRQGVVNLHQSGATRALLRDWRALSGIAYLLAFIAIRLTINGGLQTFMPLYFSKYSELGHAAVAQFLTTLSIAGTIGTLFSGPLADRIGRRVVIALAMGMCLVALQIFFNTSGWLQIAALAVAGAVMSAPWTLSVIMMQEALPNHVGLASGLSLGTAYGAMGLGVSVLGSVADTYGLPLTMNVVLWLPLVVLVMGVFVPEKKRD